MNRAVSFVVMVVLVVSLGQSQAWSDERWDAWIRTNKSGGFLHPDCTIPELVSGEVIRGVIPGNMLLKKTVWQDQLGHETEGRMISFAVEQIFVFREHSLVKVAGFRREADEYKKLTKERKLFVQQVTRLKDDKEVEKLAVALRGQHKSFAYDAVIMAVTGKNDIEGIKGVFMPPELTLPQSLVYMAEPGLIPPFGVEKPNNVFLIPVASLALNKEETESLEKCRLAIMEKAADENAELLSRRIDAAAIRRGASRASDSNAETTPKPGDVARPAINRKPVDDICLSCKGSGRSSLACSMCGGTGHLQGNFKNPACSACRGTGFGECFGCHGTGHMH